MTAMPRSTEDWNDSCDGFRLSLHQSKMWAGARESSDFGGIQNISKSTMAGFPPDASSWDPHFNPPHINHEVNLPFVSNGTSSTIQTSNNLLAGASTIDSTSQQQSLLGVGGPLKRKAKGHRKRHVPVGPAGVWYQTQRQTKSSDSTKAKSMTADEETHREEDDIAASPFQLTSSKETDKNARSFYSSAWMCMQCQLNITTPALPAFTSHSERYEVLRPHYHSQYTLLYELVHENALWKSRRQILVLINSIHSLTDNLWTVELTDETGVTMNAWVQPKLVREEQQRQQPSFVRPGLVWLLENPTMILAEREETMGVEAVRLDRMLLISQENILKVWTPGQAEKDISDTDYVQWLENRNTLSSQAMSSIHDRGQEEETDDAIERLMEQDFELERSLARRDDRETLARVQALERPREAPTTSAFVPVATPKVPTARVDRREEANPVVAVGRNQPAVQSTDPAIPTDVSVPAPGHDLSRSPLTLDQTATEVENGNLVGQKSPTGTCEDECSLFGGNKSPVNTYDLNQFSVQSQDLSQSQVSTGHAVVATPKADDDNTKRRDRKSSAKRRRSGRKDGSSSRTPRAAGKRSKSKSSSKRKAKRHSPMATASNLWTNDPTHPTLLEMFDECSEDDMGPPASRYNAKADMTSVKENVLPGAVRRKDGPEEVANASIFRPEAFAGLDLDDFFDED